MAKRRKARAKKRAGATGRERESPTSSSTSAVGGSQKPGESEPSPDKTPAKKTVRRRRVDDEPKDVAPDERASDPDEREATRSEGASSRPKSRGGGQPWWIYGVAAVLVGMVAYTHLREDTDSDDDLAPVEVDPSAPRAERLRVEVINRFPHQTDAFTQGLLFYDGYLYESTGQRRRSTIRRVDLETGEVLQRHSVEDRIFAEGLARVGDELFQLSWTAGEAHVHRLSDFELLRTYEYDGQGWGLCYDGTHLVMSDGSDQLVFRDPETFEVVRSVTVRLDGVSRDQLNELECVDGAVWANVWQTDRIVRIDPADGTVTATVDASGLLSSNEAWVADVLNGIAWIESRGHFVITGKYWPYLFEVDFVPVDEDED